jgi:hypothetical protein
MLVWWAFKTGMLRRLLLFVFLAAVFIAAIQFIPAYFYASEFDDFVKDELKFTPSRESPQREHLVDHILQSAMHYGVEVNREDIVVKKSKGGEYQKLTVSVSYSMPVDLYYFTWRLHRQVNASTAYLD